MRRWLTRVPRIAALVVVPLLGMAAGTVIQSAFAQHPPAEMMAPPPGPPGGMGHRRPPFDPSMFALVFRPADRALTAPEVQKIAEAFLLWNGNRAWKVVEVAEAADNTVGFALATAEGSVIARFSMDRATGRVTRGG